ncbi:MAG TPA: hypothetical protein VF763_03795 [Candidatus Limnocylindrales bacterium]
MRPAYRTSLLAAAALAVPLVLGACASSRAPTWTYAAADPAVARPAAVAAPAVPAAVTGSGLPFRQNLTIVTGGMIGKTEFPAFLPSDFTLPAYSTIEVVVTNFDDATPLPKASERYAEVSGTTAGRMTVEPLDLTRPNAAGVAHSLTGLDPSAVSHTFTVPQLGINVPIAAHSRVSFLIHTGAPGTYAWRCYDPCGDGPAGWGTAMAATSGYMEGTITVA